MVKKRTSARMARLVTQWRQSGESQASFARRHHIPGWTFWDWCRKLSDEPTTEAADTGASMFVPVRVASDPPAPVLEIVLNREYSRYAPSVPRTAQTNAEADRASSD